MIKYVRVIRFNSTIRNRTDIRIRLETEETQKGKRVRSTSGASVEGYVPHLQPAALWMDCNCPYVE